MVIAALKTQAKNTAHKTHVFSAWNVVLLAVRVPPSLLASLGGKSTLDRDIQIAFRRPLGNVRNSRFTANLDPKL
jgi:hypothetical protein